MPFVLMRTCACGPSFQAAVGDLVEVGEELAELLEAGRFASRVPTKRDEQDKTPEQEIRPKRRQVTRSA